MHCSIDAHPKMSGLGQVIFIFGSGMPFDFCADGVDVHIAGMDVMKLTMEVSILYNF